MRRCHVSLLVLATAAPRPPGLGGKWEPNLVRPRPLATEMQMLVAARQPAGTSQAWAAGWYLRPDLPDWWLCAVCCMPALARTPGWHSWAGKVPGERGSSEPGTTWTGWWWPGSVPGQSWAEWQHLVSVTSHPAPAPARPRPVTAMGACAGTRGSSPHSAGNYRGIRNNQERRSGNLLGQSQPSIENHCQTRTRRRRDEINPP